MKTLLQFAMIYFFSQSIYCQEMYYSSATKITAHGSLVVFARQLPVRNEARNVATVQIMIGKKGETPISNMAVQNLQIYATSGRKIEFIDRTLSEVKFQSLYKDTYSFVFEYELKNQSDFSQINRVSFRYFDEDYKFDLSVRGKPTADLELED